MSEWVELCLPYPPSVNHYWKHTKSGRHYITAAGREFKATAVQAAAKFEPFAGAVEVRLEIYFPDKRRRDLDNLCKGIFDSLSASGLILDDDCHTVRKYSIENKGIKKGGQCVVKIKAVE